MTTMDKRKLCLSLAATVVGRMIGSVATRLVLRHSLDRSSGTVLAQSSRVASPGSTVELEDFLFVQNPRAEGSKEGLYIMWIPQVAQKYCLEKTARQCIDIDYCIRTTNRKTPTCQNLS